jgi:hypothetical protein
MTIEPLACVVPGMTPVPAATSPDTFRAAKTKVVRMMGNSGRLLSENS